MEINYWYVIIVVALVAITYACILRMNQESYFQTTTTSTNETKTKPILKAITLGQPVIMNEGTYWIKNYENVDLTSSAFTPVQCNNFDIGIRKPSMERDWTIKPIDNQGVYQLFKPNQNECLYAGLDNKLKSYFWSDVNCGKRKNICGLDTVNQMGELDERSLPTYFKMLYTVDKQGVLLQNMESNKFVCMQGPDVSMKERPDLSCVFKLRSVAGMSK
jgi:hypothetical protein